MTTLIIKNTCIFPFPPYNNGWVLMERKTESVKKLSCLPCQSLQTLSLSFDHPHLFLSFFALRDETDTHTHKPTNDKHTIQTGISRVVVNNLGREKKKEPKGLLKTEQVENRREREGKIRQTEEERTNSTPTGVVNEHEKYMKGLFPRSDGCLRLWNTNTSLSLQNIPPFTPENTFSPFCLALCGSKYYVHLWSLQIHISITGRCNISSVIVVTMFATLCTRTHSSAAVGTVRQHTGNLLNSGERK